MRALTAEAEGSMTAGTRQSDLSEPDALVTSRPLVAAKAAHASVVRRHAYCVPWCEGKVDGCEPRMNVDELDGSSA